jgi:hypothetical protein
MDSRFPVRGRNSCCPELLRSDGPHWPLDGSGVPHRPLQGSGVPPRQLDGSAGGHHWPLYGVPARVQAATSTQSVHEYFNRLPDSACNESNGHVLIRGGSPVAAVNTNTTTTSLSIACADAEQQHGILLSYYRPEEEEHRVELPDVQHHQQDPGDPKTSVIMNGFRSQNSCLTAENDASTTNHSYPIATTVGIAQKNSRSTVVDPSGGEEYPEPESPDTILEEGLAATGDDFQPLLVSRNRNHTQQQQHHHHRHSTAIYSFTRFQEKVHAHLSHAHPHHHHRFRSNRVDSYNGSLCDAFMGQLTASKAAAAAAAAAGEGSCHAQQPPSNCFSLEEGLHLYDSDGDDFVVVRGGAAAVVSCSIPPVYQHGEQQGFQILSNNDSEINLELSATASEPDLVRAVAAAIAELTNNEKPAASKKKHVSINTDPAPENDTFEIHRQTEWRQRGAPPLSSCDDPARNFQPLRSSLKQHCTAAAIAALAPEEGRRTGGSGQRPSCYEMVEFGINPFEARTSPVLARQMRRKSSCLCWNSCKYCN